jgi:hypothetical protein
MKRRLIAATVAALGITALAAAPAHAVETDACRHLNSAGLSAVILVHASQVNGGAYGQIAKGQCTRSKYGWGDAQKFYVGPGQKVKFWEWYYDYGWLNVATVDPGGWHRTATYAGTTAWMTIHND